MNNVLITGSAGLVGSECVKFFSSKCDRVIGIDNNMRKEFFGKEASTEWCNNDLISHFPNYCYHNSDIRDLEAIKNIFSEYSERIDLIIHAAAQPSHDWAVKNPFTDFTVNANGTLNLLELTREYCPDAVFIFVSTNKVYGDRPNYLPLHELETRYELDRNHPLFQGVDETMSIDRTKHSLFGASKVAADILVQEYGRYFGMKTGIFRGGCLTGPAHSGTMLHGFLSYLIRCAYLGKEYHILGYKGKQVRDNIHSYDLVNAFYHFALNPKSSSVYNIGGSRHSNCSILEAISLIEEMSGKKVRYRLEEQSRIGDHIWWISNVETFRKDYPAWNYKYGLKNIIKQICQNWGSRLKK